MGFRASGSLLWHSQKLQAYVSHWFQVKPSLDRIDRFTQRLIELPKDLVDDGPLTKVMRIYADIQALPLPIQSKSVQHSISLDDGLFRQHKTLNAKP